MRVAFRADSTISSGTGHLARCLTLADEVRKDGETLFLCRYITPYMRKHIESRGHSIVLLPTREQPAVMGDLAHSSWLGVTQDQDADDSIAVLGSGGKWDWLVVDHYAIDARWEARLALSARRLFAIDDLADRQHQVNILLDQNLQYDNEDRYAGLLQSGTRRLIGTRFALLRPEFRALREAAGDAPRTRINVFFGGTDQAGVTLTALEALQHSELRGYGTDVIVGSDNPWRERIAAQTAQLHDAALHVQPSNMSELFMRARLALGAGGATSWERCCLGVPTLLVSVAVNQQNGCRALAQRRAAILVGDLSEATARRWAAFVSRMIARPRLLASMAKRAADLVDGLGTQRVVEAMRCA